MEALLSTLALAAVSSITFIAYKHPAAYRRLYMPIFALITIAVCGLLGWEAGNAAGFEAAIKFVPKEQVAAATVAASAFRVSPGMVTLGFLLSGAYLAFLLNLPHILSEKNR